MTATPKKFGFIRTTLALWAANLFPGRAGVVTDAPVGSSTSETWGWYDGSAWKYAAKRGGNEVFGSLTLNGATRPAWDTDRNATQLDSLGSIWSSGSGVRFARGMYYQGAFKAISPAEYASFISLGSDGGFEFASADALVAAGAVASVNARFRVSRIGAPGFYGVTPPATRPTVNAACTDLATCVALTNQLRAAMVACGLVQ